MFTCCGHATVMLYFTTMAKSIRHVATHSAERGHATNTPQLRAIHAVVAHLLSKMGLIASEAQSECKSGVREEVELDVHVNLPRHQVVWITSFCPLLIIILRKTKARLFPKNLDYRAPAFQTAEYLTRTVTEGNLFCDILWKPNLLNVIWKVMKADISHVSHTCSRAVMLNLFTRSLPWTSMSGLIN